MPTSDRFDPSAWPIDGHDLAVRARDAAYAAVGLGVLGLQRAQVQRRELAKRADLDDRMAHLRTAVATGVQQLDEWFETTVQLVESSLQPLEEQLPAPAHDLAGKAIDQVRELSAQLRQLVSPED